jgi:L-lactate dehydrogenase (cytochrome)
LKLREITQLVALEPPEWRIEKRRLSRCNQVDDLRRLALRRIPRAIFDYVEGGADEELTMARDLAAFRSWEFVPVNPRDVSTVDTSTTLLGSRIQLPLVCSPTGYNRMMHPDGEVGVARAASEAGVPYSLSTVASTSIEDVAASRHGDLWFQLYVWRDRGLVRELMTRAWEAGYRVLEVAVDVPVSGFRVRDVRNGLTIPPRLTARTLVGIASKPAYWIGVVSHPAIEFANSPSGLAGEGITIENMSALFDPSLTWSDISTVREEWPGALLIKGAFGPEGAREALAAGVDGLHLSAHGGRQLDRLVPPVELLPEVRQAVGDDVTIVVDSGIRHGSDVAVAIALGADAAAIGRAYLYGLMAAGEAGVAHVLALLAAEFRRTMELLGVASVEELRALGPQLLRKSGPYVSPLQRTDTEMAPVEGARS